MTVGLIMEKLYLKFRISLTSEMDLYFIYAFLSYTNVFDSIGNEQFL